MNTGADPLVFTGVKLKTELVKLVQIRKFYLYIRDSSYISLVAYLLEIISRSCFCSNENGEVYVVHWLDMLNNIDFYVRFRCFQVVCNIWSVSLRKTVKTAVVSRT